MGIKYYKQRERNIHALDKVLLLASLLNSRERMYVTASIGARDATLLQNPPNDRTYFTHVSTANFANFKTLFLALYLLKIQSENGFEVGR